jgi:hypothetical protein
MVISAAAQDSHVCSTERAMPMVIAVPRG